MLEITIEEARDRYRQIYMASRNLAGRTRVEYLNDLDDLLRFLDNQNITRVSQVAFSHLEQYLALLDQRGYAGAA